MRWPASGALGVALLAGCGRGGEPSSAVADDAGRSVRLERPASRIVSLSPAFTELLFDLGAGDRVVGRTRWGQDPPEALAVPSVGEGLDPNVEVIVACRPDLVLFYRSGANGEAIGQLDRLGIATVSLTLDGLDDLRRVARLLGKLTNTEAAADSAISVFDAGLQAASAPESDQAVSVLLLAWDEPAIVIGGGSFQSELVRLAGGQNVFGDLSQPSATVGIETIAARDPDVVLLTDGNADPAFAKRPEWQVVRAVREGRFAVIDESAFSHPSFRAVDAVRALRRALEPFRR